MKILAEIPVERVSDSPRTYHYRTELMEVEVVRVIRRRTGARSDRYFFEADVKVPERMLPECIKHNARDGTYRVNIIRRLNPKWKRPEFPPGADSIVVTTD